MTPGERVVPVACALGGVVWSGHAVLLALRPEGCVRAACAARVHRPSEDIAWVLLVAVALLVTGAALVAARAPTRGRALLRSGAALLGAGGLVLAVGLVVNATAPDSSLWWLHDSDALGRLLPVVGGLLIGLGVLAGRVLPRWVGAALVAGAGASFLFNAQDARALLALPMGLAWILAGHAAWGLGPGRGGRRTCGACRDRLPARVRTRGSTAPRGR